MADAERRAQLFEHGDLAPSRRSANNGVDFARLFFVAKARAENVIRRHDAFERRLDDLLRGDGVDVEMELVALGDIFDSARKELDVVLQANLLSGSDKQLSSYN